MGARPLPTVPAPTVPPPRPPPAVSQEAYAKDQLFEQLNSAESKTLAALTFSAEEEKLDAVALERSARNWRLAVIILLLGIVAYIGGHILLQRQLYPELFDWYDRMSRDKYKGRAQPGAMTWAPFYGMYSVATMLQHAPVGWFLCGITVWDCLTENGAQFLARSVSYALETKKELTSLHWNGNGAQTHADKLVGAGGWADATPPAGQENTPQNRQNALLANWRKGKAKDPKTGLKMNIWYDIFHDPDVDPKAFLNTCVIKQLWSDERCGGRAGVNYDARDVSTFSSSLLWELFNGGLCQIAYKHTTNDQSGDELFDFVFNGSAPLKRECGAAGWSGALSGAVGTSSLLIPLAGIPGAGLLAVGGILAGGAVGGVAGYFRGREACAEA